MIQIITCPARACISGSAAEHPASSSIRDAQVKAQSRRCWIRSRTLDAGGERECVNDSTKFCAVRAEQRNASLAPARSACSACIVCTRSTCTTSICQHSGARSGGWQGSHRRNNAGWRDLQRCWRCWFSTRYKQRGSEIGIQHKRG